MWKFHRYWQRMIALLHLTNCNALATAYAFMHNCVALNVLGVLPWCCHHAYSCRYQVYFFSSPGCGVQNRSPGPRSKERLKHVRTDTHTHIFNIYAFTSIRYIFIQEIIQWCRGPLFTLHLFTYC